MATRASAPTTLCAYDASPRRNRSCTLASCRRVRRTSALAGVEQRLSLHQPLRDRQRNLFGDAAARRIGLANIRLQGRRERLHMPSLGLAAPVTVQLRNDAGGWGCDLHDAYVEHRRDLQGDGRCGAGGTKSGDAHIAVRPERRAPQTGIIRASLCSTGRAAPRCRVTGDWSAPLRGLTWRGRARTMLRIAGRGSAALEGARKPPSNSLPAWPLAALRPQLAAPDRALAVALQQAVDGLIEGSLASRCVVEGAI